MYFQFMKQVPIPPHMIMMKTIPQIRILGDTTCGIFADTQVGKLPNGWEYRLSARLTNNPEDQVLEDMGIVRDTLILNAAEELALGQDKTLEDAIDWIVHKQRRP